MSFTSRHVEGQVLAGNLRRSSRHLHVVTPAMLTQDGTSSEDVALDLAMWEDGSTILAGNTKGDWNGTNLGRDDFAASKLDMDGTLQWKFQVTVTRRQLSVCS